MKADKTHSFGYGIFWPVRTLFNARKCMGENPDAVHREEIDKLPPEWIFTGLDIAPLTDRKLLIAFQGEQRLGGEAVGRDEPLVHLVECDLDVVEITGVPGGVPTKRFWRNTWTYRDQFTVGFKGPFRLFISKNHYVVVADRGGMWRASKEGPMGRPAVKLPCDDPMICILDELETGKTHLFTEKERFTLPIEGEFHGTPLKSKELKMVKNDTPIEEVFTLLRSYVKEVVDK
jgi:hypothetical protein